MEFDDVIYMSTHQKEPYLQTVLDVIYSNEDDPS